MAPIRVSIVNDYEVIVAGVGAMLRQFGDRVAVVETTVLGEDGLPETQADVTLFDTFGRPHLGMSDLRKLVAADTTGCVVVYSNDDDPRRIDAAMGAGASGYVHKSMPAAELADALVDISQGRNVVFTNGHRVAEVDWPGRSFGLTAREAEVLTLLTGGMRNQEIADALYVSLDTVKTHLRHVYRKLGVRTRARAVAVALTDGSFASHGSRIPSVDHGELAVQSREPEDPAERGVGAPDREPPVFAQSLMRDQ